MIAFAYVAVGAKSQKRVGYLFQRFAPVSSRLDALCCDTLASPCRRPTISPVVRAFSLLRSVLQETANTSFSPDGRVLVCGSNVRPKSDETGVLKFFDVYTAEAEPELGE